jgi:hypothetical protein
VVGERPWCSEEGPARAFGAPGSENVGISNRKAGENPARRKPKVSFATTIDEGSVGPKAMPRGGADGHTVNIP